MTVCLPLQSGERVTLSSEERQAVEALVATCRLADGFDPCLEFDTNLNANAALPAWRLVWAEPAAGTRTCGEPLPMGRAAKACGILVGAANFFGPSHEEAEISACVAPVFRRKGIFTAMYSSLVQSLVTSGVQSLLLVSESASPLGETISAKLGASLDHSEYLMTFPEERFPIPETAGDIRLLPLGPDSIDEMVRISLACFDKDEADARNFIFNAMAEGKREMFLARDAGGIFGTVSMVREPDGWMLHGLGVLPSMRSKGYGGKMLDAAVQVLAGRQAGAIRLEVDSENQAARALYLSRGFVESTRIDYWKLPCESNLTK